MTSDCEWDPSKFDKDLDDLAAYYDPFEEDHEGYHFDQHGEYRHRTVATHSTCLEEEFYDANKFLDFDEQVDNLMDAIHTDLVSNIYGVHSTEVSKVAPNFDLLRPLFGWALPSSAPLQSQHSMLEDVFRTPLSKIGGLVFLPAM
jgi:hypothetical protein